MKKKRLILLDGYYPYGHGEEFIESEISYVASKFDEIIILPTHLSGSEKITRTVPKNCKVFPVVQRKKIQQMLYTIPAFTTGMINYDGWKETLIDLWFSTSVSSLYSQVKQILKEHSIVAESSTSTVIYSYWMFKEAAVAIMLRDKYFSGNAKAVSRAHRFDVYPQHYIAGHLPARPFIASKIDMLFPISESANHEIHKIKTAQPICSTVSRLGVQASTLNAPRTRPAICHFLTCSSLLAVKRLPLIVAAMKELYKQQGKSFRWTHIGDSGKGSGRRLDEMVHDAGLSEVFTNMGRLGNSEVIAEMEDQKYSFLVNYSESEGVPVTIMEAFSCYLPVIAGDVGGIGELVKDQVNGFVDSYDPTEKSLVKMLIKAMNCSETEYSALSQNSYETWKNMADARANYQKFTQQLLDLN